MQHTLVIQLGQHVGIDIIRRVGFHEILLAQIEVAKDKGFVHAIFQLSECLFTLVVSCKLLLHCLLLCHGIQRASHIGESTYELSIEVAKTNKRAYFFHACRLVLVAYGSDFCWVHFDPFCANNEA